MLTVENTGERLTPQVVATVAEPFLRGTERVRTDHAGVGLGVAIVKEHHRSAGRNAQPHAPGRRLRVTVQLPVASPHTGR